MRAAVVYGAPPSGAGTGLAWQIVAFDEDRGFREPAPLRDLDVVARQGRREVRWHGATNDDGAVEMQLPFATPAGRTSRSGRQGASSPPATPTRSAAAGARAARDVVGAASRGARATSCSTWPSSGSAWRPASPRASGCARRTPRRTRRSPASSSSRSATPSFVPAASRRDDRRARLGAHRRRRRWGTRWRSSCTRGRESGRAGEWAGGLFVSPGAAELARRSASRRTRAGDRRRGARRCGRRRTWRSTTRTGARGPRAVPVKGAPGEMPRATVRVPPLAPGLYWAVAAGDPAGASELGPGTIARPFFVAASDEAALAFGTDPETCAPPPRRARRRRVVGACLALAGATPVPRWTALDGLHDAARARRGEARAGARARAVGDPPRRGARSGAPPARVGGVAGEAPARRRRAAREDGAGRLVGRGWTVGSRCSSR